MCVSACMLVVRLLRQGPNGDEGLLARERSPVPQHPAPTLQRAPTTLRPWACQNRTFIAASMGCWPSTTLPPIPPWLNQWELPAALVRRRPGAPVSARCIYCAFHPTRGQCNTGGQAEALHSGSTVAESGMAKWNRRSMHVCCNSCCRCRGSGKQKPSKSVLGMLCLWLGER